MNDLEQRLAALSPEKRRLLEMRLEQQGMHPRRSAGASQEPSPAVAPVPSKAVDFSLFFFSADGSSDSDDKYRLLLDSASYGDRAGFSAVWTPERHFQDFGGLYPNPSVVAAALAMVTERLQIRAGSVVLPLHHPVRVTEEWAVVDNLSRGRAAISCASGWHPADFVLRPETYDERKDVMFRDIETIRKLWAGETLTLPGGGNEPYELRVLPRPVQAELPIWVTSAGSAHTWERAGEAGTHLLVSMAAQPLADLERKIALYRAARERAGHDPATGIVSLMLHTFLGDDVAATKEKVRAPLQDYLRTHMRQRDNFLDLPGITESDKEALIPLAFEHYVSSASLIGTVASCTPLVDRLALAGVDDIACLVDFGLPAAEVLASLEVLAELRRHHQERVRAAAVGGAA